MQFVFAQQQMQVKKNDYTSFTKPSAGKYIPQKIISEELLDNTPEQYRSNPDFGILPINAPDDCYELIQKRTLDSRYYVKNNTGGKVFYTQQSYGPINYVDPNGYLRAIDSVSYTHLTLPTSDLV